MTRVLAALSLVALLTACGVDGAPTKPTVTGKQTFGVNSNSGAYTSTSIGIEISAD